MSDTERRELASVLHDLVSGWARVTECKADVTRAAELLLAPAAGWQPIETAPKDWTEILAWNKQWDDEPYIARFSEGYGWQDKEFGYTDPESENEKPTHWMPLPPPPSEPEPTPQRTEDADAAWAMCRTRTATSPRPARKVSATKAAGSGS